MKIRAAFFTLVFFTLSIGGFAQTSRGTVSGTITDPTGAVISGANVTLTNTATTVSRSTVTNSEGIYRFDAVDLGDYTRRDQSKPNRVRQSGRDHRQDVGRREHTRAHRPGDGALHRFGCGKRAHRHARTQHRADEGNQQLRLHGAKRGPSPRRTGNPLPHRILQHLQPPAIWVRKHQPVLTERGGAVG
jgi:Carboxypeptidase regulatory-like domain